MGTLIYAWQFIVTVVSQIYICDRLVWQYSLVWQYRFKLFFSKKDKTAKNNHEKRDIERREAVKAAAYVSKFSFKYFWLVLVFITYRIS